MQISRNLHNTDADGSCPDGTIRSEIISAFGYCNQRFQVRGSDQNIFPICSNAFQHNFLKHQLLQYFLREHCILTYKILLSPLSGSCLHIYYSRICKRFTNNLPTNCKAFNYCIREALLQFIPSMV